MKMFMIVCKRKYFCHLKIQLDKEQQLNIVGRFNELYMVGVIRETQQSTLNVMKLWSQI